MQKYPNMIHLVHVKLYESAIVLSNLSNKNYRQVTKFILAKSNEFHVLFVNKVGWGKEPFTNTVWVLD